MSNVLTRCFVYWPDGDYSLCVRVGDEWLLRLPNQTHIGARRPLPLSRIVHTLGGRLVRMLTPSRTEQFQHPQ